MAIFLYIVGILLILINSIYYLKEKNAFKSVFKKNQEAVTEEKISIVNMRKEFAETVLELQQEIQEIKSRFSIDKEEEIPENQEDETLEEEPKELVENKESTHERNSGVRVNEIEELLKSGFSIDEICEKLGIGKGEVLLIKELYLK
ncbi:hypothetical protein IAI10_08205 [Clostridium sp. 19966]|uniref:DUF6115 domain-containing protein n=1 Tax=Clostridium sp. 19966 TaxID=2768166 RepID=UPI0028E04CDE|nr:hypothetical protein [Clostridium sp. 19966]MDT8716637.1 hypothetical protein [Clostridium sp. 19966]